MTFDMFQALNLLWLVPVIIFVLIYEKRKRDRLLYKLADFRLLPLLTGPEKKGRRLIKAFLTVLVFILLAFALSGPRWGSRYQEVERKGVDIIVLLDVSPSMLVEDIEPNRLQRAKREIQDLINVLQGDRLGLVVFSRSAFVLFPLTLDYDACRMFLTDLSPEVIPNQGTDIGEGINLALKSFDTKLNTDKVILLITDGEDHEGTGRKKALEAKKMGARIFVFGIGDPAGGPIPSKDKNGGFLKDNKGKLILSKLDEKGLEKIAAMTGGDYVRSTSGDLDLDTIYFSGIKMKTHETTLKSGKIKIQEEKFSLFLVAALLLFLLEGSIYERGKIEE